MTVSQITRCYAQESCPQIINFEFEDGSLLEILPSCGYKKTTTLAPTAEFTLTGLEAVVLYQEGKAQAVFTLREAQIESGYRTRGILQQEFAGYLDVLCQTQESALNKLYAMYPGGDFVFRAIQDKKNLLAGGHVSYIRSMPSYLKSSIQDKDIAHF